MGCGPHPNVPAFAWLAPAALRGWGEGIKMPQSKYTELTCHKWGTTVSRRLEWLLHWYRNSLWVVTDIPFGWLLLSWSPEISSFFFLSCPASMSQRWGWLTAQSAPSPSRSQTQQVTNSSCGWWQPGTVHHGSPVVCSHIFTCLVSVMEQTNTSPCGWEALERETTPRADQPPSSTASLSWACHLPGDASGENLSSTGWSSAPHPAQLLTNHSFKTTPAAFPAGYLETQNCAQRERQIPCPCWKATSFSLQSSCCCLSPVPHGNVETVGNVGVEIFAIIFFWIFPAEI